MSYRYVPKQFVFSKITSDIEVKVEPVYMPDHSNPRHQQYVWAYNVVIENKSTHKIKLLNRHWKITDARGCSRDVRGTGVLGEQPVLGPGEAFGYSSHTVLPTPSGFMTGDYEVVDDAGRTVRVDIPAFTLDDPSSAPLLN